MKSLGLVVAAVACTTCPTLAVPQASPTVCGFQLLSCAVSDPTRKEAPWAGSTNAFPQCYDPVRYSCASNFLCPLGSPKILGQYACGPVVPSLPVATNSAVMPEVSITVNAPGAGDVDGIKGLNYIVDLTIDVLFKSSNGLIPYKPLYQDASSSTFGPGPNPAFPGLVVLQNTTAKKGPLMGPSTNLAGLFQLNGVATTNGLHEYNTYWNAGAALFGIGPSELVVYYVRGTAGKTASSAPGVSDDLVSNVVNIPFTISNRTSNATPGTEPYCQNGQMYTPNNATTPAGQAAVFAQVFHPTEGQMVGVNGSGWILDLLFDSTSSMSNAFISGGAMYTSGFVNQSSPRFHAGANSLLPGLVVLLNTTTTQSPLKGPGTNLAGLFQINNVRDINCETLTELWAAWLVGKPIAGHGPSQINAFLVNGTAPAYIADTSALAARPDLISDVATVNIILS